MATKKTTAPAAEFTGDRPDIDHQPKLRDIGDMEQKVLLLLEAADGEVTPEIEAIMEELEKDRNGFFERWGLHVRNDEARVEYLKGQAAPFVTEGDRILERAKVIENRVKASRERLLHEMTKRGIRLVEGKVVKLSVIQNPPKAVGIDKVPTDVAEKLFNDPSTRHLVKYTPESFEIDKDEVKKAVNAGLLPEELIDLGVGVERGNRLSID